MPSRFFYTNTWLWVCKVPFELSIHVNYMSVRFFFPPRNKYKDKIFLVGGDEGAGEKIEAAKLDHTFEQKASQLQKLDT